MVEIFNGDQDRQRLLETSDERCAKTGWQVHANELKIFTIFRTSFLASPHPFFGGFSRRSAQRGCVRSAGEDTPVESQ